ncbi:MAG: M28 family peptidase, partial [Gemmatimonadota bacterium]
MRVDYREVLRELARPRMTGTPDAHDIGESMRARLNALGYQVHDFPFTFSTLPGRFAVTVCGALLLFGTMTAAWLLNQRHPGVALVVLLFVLLLCGAVAALSPVLTTMLPFGKIAANNMLAKKPGSRPRYIVMAHRDTKSQPLPLAFRGPAIILAIVAWSVLLGIAILGLLDPVYLVARITTPVVIVALISALLLILCWTENRSPGALDNASGVTTLLGVAESDAGQDDVAYLITDAEELGLVGARAIALKLDPVIGVINIDGIDDHGAFYILEKFGFPPRHIAPHLVAAAQSAAAANAVTARRSNNPIGIQVDHKTQAHPHHPPLTNKRRSKK